MTHKIKVQMFGNFRMDYNGAPFVAEKMHKESQFNRMMQALIHYSDCGIAKDKLEEIVIGERDIDAPHTALRVIVYKTKQKLAQLGLPGKNLVYLEGGIYYWTPDIEIEEDAAEFEKLYNEACALEKQMPHEPESAETVCDERIKEIEDNMLELYIKALLNRKFDSCEWHEHLKENEIICDDNTVYIVSADADDSNGLEILANAGLENGENYFITQRFLHYTEGGFAL